MAGFFLDDLTKEKIRILYFVERVNYPLTNTQIITAGLDNAWAHYYDLQQSIANLAEQGLLALLKRPVGECYCLSDAGKQALEQFASRLPQSRRDEIDAYVQQHRDRFAAQAEHLASAQKIHDDLYAVDLRIVEGSTTLMTLSLSVASHDIATALTAAWQGRAQDVYAQVLGILGKDQ